MRFFLIDKIQDWQVGRSAEAIKNVALSEDYFDDHYPRHPVMPGVLILEGIAQLSGLLLEDSLKERYGHSAKAIMAVVERTKFRDIVRPGETLVYRTEVLSLNLQGGKTIAQASRNGKVVVSTGMTFAFKPVDDPQFEIKRDALMKIWMAL